MIKYTFKPSFDKSIKSLNGNDKKIAKALCEKLMDVFNGKKELTKGFGLTHLRNNFWEIRKGIKQRVIFKWVNNNIQFIIAGSHDQVKKFLKNR